MKLKTSTQSQRDERWGNIILGYNTNQKYNIHDFGCLITCFGNYLDKTPIEINDILKANSGFTPGSGNFIWAKCIALGLTETYVSPEYTGPVTSQGITKIKEFLDKGFPLICEIDFNPATTKEEMHFVLICGYEEDKIFAMDPWLGQVIDLDVYGGPQRAIIQFRTYNKQLSEEIGHPEENMALQVITEAYSYLPENDSLNNGSLEGYVRAIVGEHLKFDNMESKARQLDGFVSKWVLEFNLTQGSNLVEVETEMTKLLPLEGKVNEFRDAIEEVVGTQITDEALLIALKAIKSDISTLNGKLSDCELKLKKKNGVIKAFNVGNYTIKIYKK